MESSENKRHLILSVGLELLQTEGYSRLSMDALCVKAGVNKGSLYYHIISKEIFAIEAIRNYQKCIEKFLETLLQFDPENRLKHFQNYIGHVASPSDQFGLLAVLIPEWNSLPHGIHVALEKLYRFKYEWIRDTVLEGQLTGIFRKDIPADIFANIVLCYSVGGQSIRRLQNNLEPFFAFTDSILKLPIIPPS